MTSQSIDIAFGIMSATENPAAVSQLVRAIGPDYPVFIHHDFSRQAVFPVAGPNVHVLPQPTRTGWGTWGFVQGVLLLMRTAFEQSNCQYFQLLSGTCLPLRPIPELVAFVSRQREPLNADIMSLDEDDDVLMTMAFRFFSPMDSLRFKVLRRMRGLYYGPDDQADLLHRRSLALLGRPAHRTGALHRSAQGLAGMVTRAARNGIGFKHPFASAGMTPYVGSTWFGCRREVADMVLTRPVDGQLEQFTRSLLACDEIYFPTLFGNLGVDIAPSNHCVSDFVGAHPAVITPAMLPGIRASGRFFGRKFSNDPDDAARVQALSREPAESRDAPAVF